MISVVFIFSFLHLPGNEGAIEAKRVVQTPPFISKRTGQSLEGEIKCSHNITNHDMILWYKQDEHNFKLLGYINVNFAYPEDDVKGKISFEGDGRKHSDLSVSDLALNDSGVYFCAASQHSAAESTRVNTQTLASTDRMFRHLHILSVSLNRDPQDFINRLFSMTFSGVMT